MTRIKLTFTVLIPLTLVLSSCGNSMDLKTARSLAKSGDEANMVFQKIANDVYDSCLRQARYTPLEEPTQGAIDQERIKAEQLCENNPKKASEALNKANGVVTSYLKALGQLAADDLTNYDSQLNSIGSSLKELKFAPKEVDAGSEIANILFRIATDKYRRKKLKLVVTSTDSNLTTYIDGFSTAINRGYIQGTLKAEKTQIDSYYKEYLGDILTSRSTQNVDGISVTLRDTEITNLDSQWQSAKTVMLEKQQLAQRYVKLLNNIKCDHNTLTQSYHEGKMLSTAQLHHISESYAKELNLLTEKSNKLFNKNNDKIGV